MLVSFDGERKLLAAIRDVFHRQRVLVEGISVHIQVDVTLHELVNVLGHGQLPLKLRLVRWDYLLTFFGIYLKRPLS